MWACVPKFLSFRDWITCCSCIVSDKVTTDVYMYIYSREYDIIMLVYLTLTLMKPVPWITIGILWFFWFPVRLRSFYICFTLRKLDRVWIKVNRSAMLCIPFKACNLPYITSVIVCLFNFLRRDSYGKLQKLGRVYRT